MCISKLSRGFVNTHASAMKRFSYTTNAYTSDPSNAGGRESKTQRTSQAVRAAVCWLVLKSSITLAA